MCAKGPSSSCLREFFPSIGIPMISALAPISSPYFVHLCKPTLATYETLIHHPRINHTTIRPIRYEYLETRLAMAVGNESCSYTIERYAKTQAITEDARASAAGIAHRVKKVFSCMQSQKGWSRSFNIICEWPGLDVSPPSASPQASWYSGFSEEQIQSPPSLPYRSPIPFLFISLIRTPEPPVSKTVFEGMLVKVGSFPMTQPRPKLCLTPVLSHPAESVMRCASTQMPRSTLWLPSLGTV